jgi:hypothetical protein
VLYAKNPLIMTKLYWITATEQDIFDQYYTEDVTAILAQWKITSSAI